MKNKKLSKIVALAAATMLSLSVGMVAFANGSSEDGDRVATDEKGKEIVEGVLDLSTDGGRAVYDLLNMTEKEMKDEIKKILNNSPDCKYVADDVDILYVGDLELYDTETDLPVTPSNFPSGGINVTIKVSGVAAGDVVYVLHWLDNGTCEVLEGTVTADGVQVHLNSLSPVMVIKVMNAEGGKPVLKPVEDKTSPKTGK